MNGSAIDQNALDQLLEAARWAPSSYNEQEWRFLYAHREGEHWDAFFNLLMEANQTWCQHAGVLVLVVSAKTFQKNGNPNRVHSLDTGMAVQNFLLQAASMNLVAHAMAGFNMSQAPQVLRIPDEFNVECMIAVGHPGEIEVLPENYQSMESPTGRKPISEFAAEGPFQL